ncbi:MAG TPA: hypothetical protein VLG36_02160 [Candidatus Chromulinivoraceae bacterium]|nr:hypothetical protein [Candidatus Chromulinivoraceae bacterium]
MSNIFARIAGAPPSPFLQEVREARAAVEARLRKRDDRTDVQIIIADKKPITIWMQRGFEGSAFTYMVTDGTPIQGELTGHQRIIRDGTFAIEIIETRLRITAVKAHVRPGCNMQQVQALMLEADKTRSRLRAISKPASDADRTIEMVIERV